MTPEEANERLRAMCIEALDIATEQGWDWSIDARPDDREGWQFTAYTDRVDQERLRKRQQRKMQLPLETTT